MEKIPFIIFLFLFLFPMEGKAFHHTIYGEGLEQKILKQHHFNNRQLSSFFTQYETLPKNAVHYKDIILEESKKINFSPILLTAIIWTESHFKENAKSSIGAVGLMQITRPTAKYICQKIIKEKNCSAMNSMNKFKNIFFNNPRKNIQYGLAYLNYLYKKFYSTKLAILAYNEGPTRIYRMKKDILANRAFDNHQYYKKIESRFFIISNL